MPDPELEPDAVAVESSLKNGPPIKIQPWVTDHAKDLNKAQEDLIQFITKSRKPEPSLAPTSERDSSSQRAGPSPDPKAPGSPAHQKPVSEPVQATQPITASSKPRVPQPDSHTSIIKPETPNEEQVPLNAQKSTGRSGQNAPRRSNPRARKPKRTKSLDIG